MPLQVQAFLTAGKKTRKTYSSWNSCCSFERLFAQKFFHFADKSALVFKPEGDFRKPEVEIVPPASGKAGEKPLCESPHAFYQVCTCLRRPVFKCNEMVYSTVQKAGKLQPVVAFEAVRMDRRAAFYVLHTEVFKRHRIG